MFKCYWQVNSWSRWSWGPFPTKINLWFQDKEEVICQLLLFKHCWTRFSNPHGKCLMMKPSAWRMKSSHWHQLGEGKLRLCLGCWSPATLSRDLQHPKPTLKHWAGGWDNDGASPCCSALRAMGCRQDGAGTPTSTSKTRMDPARGHRLHVLSLPHGSVSAGRRREGLQGISSDVFQQQIKIAATILIWQSSREGTCGTGSISHKEKTQRAACAFSNANAGLARSPWESLAPGQVTQRLEFRISRYKFILPWFCFSYYKVR